MLLEMLKGKIHRERSAFGNLCYSRCRLDMLYNTTPEKWSFDGKERKFNWYEPAGATMDFLPV